VSNITQSLRNNKDAYNLESLFSNLLDESKRQESIEANNSEQALYIKTIKPKYKGKKPYKITKGKYCCNCKQTSHITTDCFFLFPDKAPKSWRKPIDKDKSDESEASPRDTRDNNIDILYTSTKAPIIENFSTNISDMDLDFEIREEDIQVYITSNTLNNKTSNTNIKLEPSINTRNTKFVLDTAATKHIICNKLYFIDFKACSKIVK
jgi:hypothetical protein